MEKQYRTDFTELKKEYGRLKSRNEEIDSIIGSLYADKSKGILTEKRFVKLMGDLEAEQADNEERMRKLSRHLDESDAQEGDIRLFISEIRKVGVYLKKALKKAEKAHKIKVFGQTRGAEPRPP